MLWDGSPHRWLGPEHTEITLMAAVDDADGELLAALFAPQETSLAYLQLARADRAQPRHPHGHLSGPPQRPAAQRRLLVPGGATGRHAASHTGRSWRSRISQSDPSSPSPRKPRAGSNALFGVLQDRLLAEMGLDGIHSLDAANAYLQDLDPSLQPALPHRDLPSVFRSARKLDLRKILAFRYLATVLNDNAVRLGGITIDIPPGPKKRGYAALKVDVRQHLDATWTVYYQDKILATAQPTALHEPLRYRKRPQHRGATSEAPPLPPTTADTFPRQLGGQIASA